jgi:membrane protease YdiL (CAAX protease family)
VSTERIPPRPDALHPLSEPAPQPTTLRGLAARPAVTWRWWEAIGIYVAAFFAGGLAALPVIQAFDDEDLGTIVSTVVAAIVIVGVLLFWLRAAHPGWRDALGAPRPWAPDIRAGVVFGIGLYPAVVFVIGLLFIVVFSALSGQDVQAPEQVSTDLPLLGTIVTAVYAVAIAPLGEEFFFRGILFRSIRDRHGFWAGALGSSALFGLIHYVPGPALDSLLLMSVMVFTGFGLAYIYERRGSILAPMAAHTTFNVIGLALIYALR